jgi:1-acyl-sn-glycerol-3-phosphate acyltransferase
VRKLYQLYKFLIYIPLLLIWTVLNFLGVVVVAPFSPRKASRWFGGNWGRGLMWAVPARVRVSGARHIDPGASYILVANHLSLMDIPLLYGWLPLDLKWIMKKEVRKIPIIGVGTAMLGHVFLDRSNHRAAIRELQRVKADLQPGTSILFFPEGTRSRSGRLQPFKNGAFHMARDLDLPVLPISIIGTESILTPDGMDLFPGSARLIIHPPIPADAVRALDGEALRARSRAAIASVLPEFTGATAASGDRGPPG